MKQRRRSDDSGEDAFNGLYSEMGIEIRERAIGENQADVQSNERAAPPKDKAHESADVAILLHPIAVVDPDEREVLHVVEDLEQRDADKNVRDEIIAVPPKGDAGNEQSKLHGVRSLPYDPQATEMQQKKDRDRDGRKKNQLLPVMNY